MKRKIFMLYAKFNKAMRMLITLIILLISSNSLTAQSNEQIINEILFDLFGDSMCEDILDTIFIAETKMKTFFYHDSNSYKCIMGFTIPSNIISKWSENMEKESLQPLWNEQYLNKKDTNFLGNDIFIQKKPFFKCLSENEIDKKLKRNQELSNLNNQQFNTSPKPVYITLEPVYSIGQIIFDNSKETAIFSFMRSSFSDAASGYTVLIKKVFGKWVIVTRFDYWMT
jgi:hypothetical protein